MAGALSRFYVGRVIAGRQKLVAAIVVAIAAYLLQPGDWFGATRLLIAWNIATVVYVVATLVAFAHATPKSIRHSAKITDEGRFVILVLVTLAALAATGAIFAELGLSKDTKGVDKILHFSLAAGTIVTAWIFIHLTFAMHYAHEYFDETKCEEGEKQQLKGGIDFPKTDEPDYWDFMYFSFIIGVASQTADVSISSKVIRRTSLAHSVLAFFFNSAILALSINIASGLI